LLVNLFVPDRMPLDRLIARLDFADFNSAAADATSGAAIKPVVLLLQ
jgi:Zn-dependent alcohol dehydrogenase